MWVNDHILSGRQVCHADSALPVPNTAVPSACACSCFASFLFLSEQCVANPWVGVSTNVEFLWNQICHPELMFLSSWVIGRLLSVCASSCVFFCATVLAFGSEYRSACACVSICLDDLWVLWVTKWWLEARTQEEGVCSVSVRIKKKRRVGRKTKKVTNTVQKTRSMNVLCWKSDKMQEIVFRENPPSNWIDRIHRRPRKTVQSLSREVEALLCQDKTFIIPRQLWGALDSTQKLFHSGGWNLK